MKQSRYSRLKKLSIEQLEILLSDFSRLSIYGNFKSYDRYKKLYNDTYIVFLNKLSRKMLGYD
jgi:hypothetical protein